MDSIQVAMIPIITGLCELGKQLGIPKRWIPLLSLVLGILFGVIYLYPSDVLRGVLEGLIIGLSSVGLYSGPKNLFQGEKKE